MLGCYLGGILAVITQRFDEGENHRDLRRLLVLTVLPDALNALRESDQRRAKFVNCLSHRYASPYSGSTSLTVKG